MFYMGSYKIEIREEPRVVRTSDVLVSMCVFTCVLCVSAERSGGHVDHFEIVERVEMGQMASMFFNKGNVLVASGGRS